MKVKFFFLICAVTIVTATNAKKSNSNNSNIGKGYYKDLFMDSGVGLTSRIDLPAARLLNLEMEEFVSNPSGAIATDTVLQSSIMAGSPIDANGILLYPDGAPRYRCVYVNGGLANRHGFALTDKGRNNFREYVKNGGSYVGTCAGAYLACDGVRGDTIHYWEYYLRIWPGNTRATGITRRRHCVDIEQNSPLLNYYDFGGDLRIDSVYHNGGCYGDEEVMWPKGTEVLARYDTRNLSFAQKVTGKPVIWAYKKDETTGRIISCGSHPESEISGDRLQLMSSMLLYSMDGNGTPRVKAELILDSLRQMSAETEENRPNFTRIGDKQYHHFVVDVPAGVDTLSIDLSSYRGKTDFNMYLFAHYGDFAWADNSEYENVALGFDKTLKIAAPKPGKLHLSVYCATTVTPIQTNFGTQYTGRIDVLNGVPYKIKVSNLKKK